MSKLLIRGMVLPMTGADDFFPEGEVAIENDQIFHVGPKGSTPQDFVPDRVLEYSDDVIMPGFINTHTHAAMTLLRSYADDLPLMTWLQTKIWPFEAKLTDEDIYWGTMLALGEMIKSGTTTMLDMYSSMDQVAEAVLEAGTRGVLARGLIGNAPNGEEALAEGIELVHNYHGAGNGRIKVMLGPHAPYTCNGAYLQKVKKEADRLGVGIHIHLAETEDEINTIGKETGKTPVQWLEELGIFGGHVVAAHCVHLTEEDRKILAKHKVAVAHNPESNMKLNSGAAPIMELLEEGVLVGLGTDGVSSNNNLDMFGEMRSAAFLQKLHKGAATLPAYEVLEMATVNGAKALGLDNVGMLAPGYKADIITIDFDQPHFYPRFSFLSHLVYVAHPGDVRTVIVDGKILMEEKELKTMDIKNVCSEVEKRAKRIAASL